MEDQSKTSLLMFLRLILIPLLGGWIVARAQFPNPWVQFAVVVGVVLGLIAATFPWKRLGNRTGKAADWTGRGLAAFGLAVLLLVFFSYEILVGGRGRWFVDHAVLLLVALGGLGLLLKYWVRAKAPRDGRPGA